MPWRLARVQYRALFNPGNEPSFMTPFLYNYVQGKQYKTVEKTRYLVNKCAFFTCFGHQGDIGIDLMWSHRLYA